MAKWRPINCPVNTPMDNVKFRKNAFIEYINKLGQLIFEVIN